MTAAPSTVPVLRASGVRKSVGRNRVLKRIDLELAVHVVCPEVSLAGRDRAHPRQQRRPAEVLDNLQHPRTQSFLAKVL